MEPQNLVYILLAGAVIGFFILSNPLGQVNDEDIFIAVFDTGQGEMGVNENISISIGAIGSKLEFINYSSANKSETIQCTVETACNANFSDSFAAPGNYQVKIAVGDREGNVIEEKRAIRVINREKTCIDGTRFGECGPKKPLYCEQGSFEDRCSLCGCMESHFCTAGDSCAPRAAMLEITGIETTDLNIVKIGSPFAIRVILENLGEKIFAGANYRIDLNITDSGGIVYLECRGQLAIGSDLETSGKTETTIGNCNGEKMSIGKEGIYGAAIALYGLEGNDQTLLKIAMEKGIVFASGDSVSPEAPSGLAVKKTDAGTLLNWNANSETDLAGYKIYESLSIEASYISYDFREIVNLDKNGLEMGNLEGKKYYFVMTAFDILGNESGYSSPVSIDLNTGQ